MRASDSEIALKELRDWGANVGIVLGSGLNSLASVNSEPQPIPYSRFGAVPQSSVPGHAGQFLMARVGQTPVVFAQGRVHLYEGRSAREVTAVVRLLAEAGIKTLILTNAAGSLNRSFATGEWMMIQDHINLTGTSPLVGSAQFIDMTDAYSLRLRQQFARA